MEDSGELADVGTDAIASGASEPAGRCIWEGGLGIGRGPGEGLCGNVLVGTTGDDDESRRKCVG